MCSIESHGINTLAYMCINIGITINIGVTNVFSCINICRVPRKLFEHKANSLSVQTSPEGPGKCECNETNMCDCYSCIFYLIPTQFALKTQLKHKIVHFLTLDFSKQNGVGCKLLNVITSSQHHNHTQRFREQKHWRNDQSGPQHFPYNVMQIMQGSF